MSALISTGANGACARAGVGGLEGGKSGKSGKGGKGGAGGKGGVCLTTLIKNLTMGQLCHSLISYLKGVSNAITTLQGSRISRANDERP